MNNYFLPFIKRMNEISVKNDITDEEKISKIKKLANHFSKGLENKIKDLSAKNQN